MFSGIVLEFVTSPWSIIIGLGLSAAFDLKHWILRFANIPYKLIVTAFWLPGAYVNTFIAYYIGKAMDRAGTTDKEQTAPK